MRRRCRVATVARRCRARPAGVGVTGAVTGVGIDVGETQPADLDARRAVGAGGDHVDHQLITGVVATACLHRPGRADGGVAHPDAVDVGRHQQPDVGGVDQPGGVDRRVQQRRQNLVGEGDLGAQRAAPGPARIDGPSERIAVDAPLLLELGDLRGLERLQIAVAGDRDVDARAGGTGADMLTHRCAGASALGAEETVMVSPSATTWITCG